LAFQLLLETDSVPLGKLNASVQPLMALGPVSVMPMFAT
jgi:hypothetical protein